MSDKHTIATFADGTAVRRHRSSYWPASPDTDPSYPGELDDWLEKHRGGVLYADEDDGYWTPESLLAVLCDVMRPDAGEDDESPASERWARLCDVLDEMQREGRPDE